MFAASNIHHEMADKAPGGGCGGLGAIHLVGQKIGRGDDLNEKVSVRKRQWPHQESAQGLTLADNLLAGGARLEDSELRRTDKIICLDWGRSAFPIPRRRAISRGALPRKTRWL